MKHNSWNFTLICIFMIAINFLFKFLIKSPKFSSLNFVALLFRVFWVSHCHLTIVVFLFACMTPTFVVEVAGNTIFVGGGDKVLFLFPILRYYDVFLICFIKFQFFCFLVLVIFLCSLYLLCIIYSFSYFIS